jgi:hypothetical protein
MRPSQARVKGTNVIGVVRTLRANREVALQRLPKRLHHYLEERILPSTWYPELDQIEMMRVLAHFLPVPDPFVTMGRISATMDLATVYRRQLRPTDPKRSLESAPAMWRNYHDTGEMTACSEGPHTMVIRVCGYKAVCREMCDVIGGYTTEMASQAGAKDIELNKFNCVLDGAGDCSWRISWST